MKLFFTSVAIAVLLSFSLHAQNVGVGTDSPVEFFSVGASSQFRVNASGNLVRINNVQYSFPAVQATSGSVLANDGSGNLSWTKVTTGNISATGTANNTTFLRGDGAWAAPAGGGGGPTVVATSAVVNITPAANTSLATGDIVFTHVIATTGIYTITAHVFSSSGAASGILSARTDGNVRISSQPGTGSATNYSSLHVSGTLPLSQGTTITVNLQEFDGGKTYNGEVYLIKLN